MKNVAGKKVSAVIPGILESNPELFEIYGRVASTGNSEHFEEYVEPLRSWFEVSAYSIERDYFVATFDNITERKNAEHSIRESERKYRTLLENIPHVIFMKDTQSTYLSCNENYARVLGIRASEIEGKTDYDFFPKNMADKYRNDDRKIVATGATESFVERIVLGKRETWINTVKTPVRNEAGDIVGMLGIFWDISEQRHAEQALSSSENRFRVIFESAALGMALVNAKGYSVKSNPALHAMLGYSAEELSHISFNKLTHPDDIAADRELFAELIQGRLERYDIAKRYIRKNGTLMWGLLSVSEVQVSDEEQRYAIAMIEDITTRKRTEDERARLVMAIEHTAEAIVVTNPAGVIEYVNPAFEQITGYSREEAIGQSPSILNSGRHDDSFYADMWATITRGEVWSGEIINVKKNGALYEEEMTISPVLDAAGAIVCYVAVKRDVSEHVALERRLRQAQKMEAIGTLAGGIAHDFNNILTSIVGYSEMAASEVAPDSHVRKDLDTVLGAARRAGDLVRQILTFSRRVDEQRQPLALGLIVNEAMKLLRPSLPSTIEIQTSIEKNSGLVHADPSQMHQVLMNLCTNAYHAMRETGGVLSVDLATTQVDAELSESHPGLPVGSYVRLTVADTGCGMSKDIQERVFEPFFTTKEQGEGTGLGLATVHGIVTAHGGDILVYSEPGLGTTFHVYLPCLERGEVVPAIEHELICDGVESVLLVDDEQPVVALEEKTLRQYGYKVAAFTSSIKALEVFKNDPNRFDIVITDQTMPKMTGDQLAREVKQVRPEIPVIVTTGFVGDALKQRLAEIGVAAILPKPSRRVEIAALVRKVLDGK
jgi:PAS domain S-box-containing protein